MVFLLFITLLSCSQPQYLSVSKKTLKKVTTILDGYKVPSGKTNKFLKSIAEIDEKKLIKRNNQSLLASVPYLLIRLLQKNKIIGNSSRKSQIMPRGNFVLTLANTRLPLQQVMLVDSLERAISGEIWKHAINDRCIFIKKHQQKIRKNICNYCKIKAITKVFKKCPCSKVFYCSKLCQKKDWKAYHRYQCQNYRTNDILKCLKYFCENNYLKVHFSLCIYTKYEQLGNYIFPDISLKNMLKMLGIFNIRYNKTMIENIKEIYKESFYSKFFYDPDFDIKIKKEKELELDHHYCYSNLGPDNVFSKIANPYFAKKMKKEFNLSGIYSKLFYSAVINAPLFSFADFLFLYTLENNYFLTRLIIGNAPLLLKSYLQSIWKKYTIVPNDEIFLRLLRQNGDVTMPHIHYVNDLSQWVLCTKNKIIKNRVTSGIFIKAELFKTLSEIFKLYNFKAYLYTLEFNILVNKKKIELFMINNELGIFFDFLQKPNIVKDLKLDRINMTST